MTATVTVPANQGPVADAGADVQVLLAAASVSVTLDGSSSTDPDGTLAVFAWTQLSGPASATIATPGNAMTTAQLTAPGAYEFELRVTDDRGASARDTVVVTVTTPAAPCGPIAQAGRDVMILWPANATVLDGSASSAPEGAIIGYAWEQVAGPAAGCATGHDRARLTLTGLARGVYRFRLTVTDARGRTASDEVHVVVERRRP
jgi:hypothetical protein